MKVKAYVFMENHFDTKPWRPALWSVKLDDEKYRVFLYEADFDVTVPENFDPTPQQIAALRAEQQRIRAEAHVKAENIEEQIQQLLCIENKAEA